jgi:transcriptional regulator with XRE-family HTH domain
MANEVVERLRRDFQDSDYRHVYANGFLDSSIATQIKVLREGRQWTQSDLAREANMVQSRISEIEDINYSSWSIRTLRRLAKALDLRLKVSFEEFGTLLTDYKRLNRASLTRRAFSVDPEFSPHEHSGDVAALSALLEHLEAIELAAPEAQAQAGQRPEYVCKWVRDQVPSVSSAIENVVMRLILDLTENESVPTRQFPIKEMGAAESASGGGRPSLLPPRDSVVSIRTGHSFRANPRRRRRGDVPLKRVAGAAR